MKRHHRFAGLMLVSVVGGVLQGGTVFGAEHGGQEHGGQEHGGMTTAAPTSAPAATTPTASLAQPPSAGQIRQAVEAYVQEVIDADGSFRIEDPVTGTMRSLTLERVHERVGKTGDLFYSCTDMKDAASGETLDLDYDLDNSTGRLEVVDVRIHKVSNQPRYTYDDQDRRIPIKP